MKRLKILYLTFHPHIGGGEIILLSLLANLNNKVFAPVVVVTGIGQLSQRLKELDIKTHILPLSPYFIRFLFIPGFSVFGIYQFLKLTRKIKPDLIHINHLNLALYSGIARNLLKIPVVATAHGPWDAIYFYQDLVANLFVDEIFAATPEVAKTLLARKIINPKKVGVVPFGIDTKIFKPGNTKLARRILGLPENDLIVSIVGRLDPEKDHLNFLAAAKKVLASFPKVSFFIVGSTRGDFSASMNLGNTEIQIRKFLANNKGLLRKVIFGGFIDNMPKVYQATDILVSSSLAESFGLALAEAAACEVSVVATSVGGQNLIVKDNQTGFLVPPKKPNLLAKKVIQLAKNPKLREEFGQNGRQHIVENFNLEKYVKKVEGTYLSLLETAQKNG